jgi:hypothetical protein
LVVGLVVGESPPSGVELLEEIDDEAPFGPRWEPDADVERAARMASASAGRARSGSVAARSPPLVATGRWGVGRLEASNPGDLSALAWRAGRIGFIRYFFFFFGLRAKRAARGKVGSFQPFQS